MADQPAVSRMPPSMVFRAKGKSMSLLKRIEQQPPTSFQDKFALREWWHGILRDHGHRYSCYAIFLILPSDKETIRYLTDFGKELDIISGDNCLVIALGKTEFRRSGFDEEVRKPTMSERFSNYLDEVWNTAIKEHVSKGYSVKVAELFNVELVKFPCLLLFQDIRSSNHTLVTLKGMTAEEIAERMRFIFSIIHKAVINKDDPLDLLAQYQDDEAFRKAGNTILSKVTGFAEKTFETAMEAWISSTIK
jgi:hypothetical protein